MIWPSDSFELSFVRDASAGPLASPKVELAFSLVNELLIISECRRDSTVFIEFDLRGFIRLADTLSSEIRLFCDSTILDDLAGLGLLLFGDESLIRLIWPGSVVLHLFPLFVPLFGKRRSGLVRCFETEVLSFGVIVLFISISLLLSFSS